MKKIVLFALFALFAAATHAQTLEVKDGKVQRKCTHPSNGIVYYESATPMELEGQIEQTNAAIAMLKIEKSKEAKDAEKELSAYIKTLNKELVEAKKLDATITKPTEPNIDEVQK